MEQRFKCSCYTHELHVELPEEKDDNLIEIVVWSLGNAIGSSLGFRLKQCWQVLTKGHAYKDMVVLQPDEALRLGQTLVKMGDVAKFRQKTITKEANDSPVVEATASFSGTQPLASIGRIQYLKERIVAWVRSLFGR